MHFKTNTAISTEMHYRARSIIRVDAAVAIAARQQPELAIRKASIPSWILGFISGINVDTPDVDFLAGTDPESLWSSIDKYCREHPLHDMGDAVSSLAMTLLRIRA
jgi:hypothetical protein